MRLNSLRAKLAIGTVVWAGLSSVAFAEGVGLAFSPLSLDIPALKGLSEGVQHVGTDMGYDVVILDPKFDVTAQQTQLLQLIEAGRIKAAWVMPVNTGAMGGVIDAAKAAGAVLVVTGYPAEYGFEGMVPGITFANLDQAAFGGGAGTLAGECANKVLGGKGKALIIQQREGTSGKAEIDAAIVENLAAAAPGVEVVSTIITTERAESLTKVGQVLQANPDINVVVTAHDEGGLGALGAFEAAGKEIPCLVDMGGNAEVLAAVESGAMYGAVALDFQGDLMQTFDAFKTMLADPTAPGRQQTVPLTIKTRP